MKNKKSIMAILIAVIVLVGVTVAYFTTTTSFDNEFVTATYKTTSTEVFNGPTNWTPGEEVAKTVTTKNEGSIPIAVRVSYTENWKDKNGVDLDPQPSNKVTVNLDHTGQWTKEGNYYYYNFPVEPNEETSSFMKSVTLNSNAISSDSTTCTTSQDGKSKTCEATDSLAGAHYTLTLTIETVQYDAYKTAWNTNVTIEPKRGIAFVSREDEDEITTGDLVKIGDTEEFYVVSSDAEKTVLLAHYNLNVGNNKNPDVTEGLQHSSVVGQKTGQTTYGNVPFSGSETYLSAYRNILEGTGVTLNRVRNLTVDETYDLGCNRSMQICLESYPNPGSPSWVYETTYYLDDETYDFIFLGSDGWYAVSDDSGEDIGIRPVIEISTSYLN